MSLPTITVVIPTFNEVRNIGRCLESIFSQSYPKDKLETFIVDDFSTDKTLEIARQFPVKVLTHNSKDPEAGKVLAFEKATGDLFIYFDADIHLRGKDWFKKMIKPLEDPNIIASFTRYYSDEHSTSIEKYLNLDPLQRDSIYQYFSPGLEGLIVEEKSDYKILGYQIDKIPPTGLCLHRKKLIEPFLKNKKRFLELDLLVELVKNGNKKFAYVPDAGLFHHHAKTLVDLLKKRSRNVTRVYLKNNEARKYRWFNLESVQGILKVLFWVLWANLFLPSLLSGLYKTFRFKTLVAFYEPVVNILVTDIILIAFLADFRGRKLLRWG